MSEMEKNKYLLDSADNNLGTATQPQTACGRLQDYFTFHDHLSLLFLRWTAKAKHNLLNAAKPSDEDHTLPNYC